MSGRVRGCLVALAAVLMTAQVFGATTAITAFTAQDASMPTTSTPAVLTKGAVSAAITATPGDGLTITGYMVIQDDPVAPPPEDIGWSETGTISYEIAEGTADGPVLLYAWVKDSSGMVVGPSKYTITYITGTEISRSAWKLDASTSEYSPSWAIDNSAINFWRCFGSSLDTAPWLRIDLGARYEVSSFIYMGPPNSANHRIKDYRLYVMDIDSTDPARWDAEVKTGTFASLPSPNVASGKWGTAQVVSLDSPVIGRYIILRALSTYAAWAGATEVWALGTPATAVTHVDTFTVSDSTTTAPAYLTYGSMEVTISASAGDGLTITGYMITVNDDTPPNPNGAGWEPEITSFTMPAGTPAGYVTLRAWARDSAGNVTAKACTVTYGKDPEIPKAGLAVTANDTEGGGGFSTAKTIDSKPDLGWRSRTTAPWVRIDLGDRYAVSEVLYLGRQTSADGSVTDRTKDYRLYVTDLYSADPATWTMVTSGSFANLPNECLAAGAWSIPQPIVLDTPAVGRYVILQMLNTYANCGWPSIGELWVFGNQSIRVTSIDAFSVADVDESNPAKSVLTSGTVTVAAGVTAGDDVTVTGYQITVNDATQPEAGGGGWLPGITELTMPEGTEQGIVTLYLWVLDSSGYVAGSKPCTMNYFTGTQIDKSVMTIAASSTDGAGLISRVLNSQPDDAWRCARSDPAPWLRIDLGSRHNVDNVLYMGNPSNTNFYHRMKDYELYVTDVDSTDPADWGSPVQAGTVQNLPLPVVAIGQWGTPQSVGPADAVAGRFVILRLVSAYSAWPGASEMWVYGTPAAVLTSINGFSAADADEANAARSVLTGGTMDVTIDALPGDNVTITGYQITVNDNIPPDPGSAGWQPEITQFTMPAGTPEGINTLYAWVLDSSGYVAAKAQTITYCTGSPIDKSLMTATAGSTDGAGTPSKVINDQPDDAWRVANDVAQPWWLRIDLGTSCNVTRFVYMGNPGTENHRIKDYLVYVTDMDSPNEADWGEAAQSGTFASVPSPVAWPQWGVPQVVMIDPPATGRYVILRPLNAYAAWPGASEVWVYGAAVPTGPVITSFTAADQTTGSALFTNSSTVNVSITAEPVAPETPVAGVLVTETPDVPDVNDPGWAESITEYTITGGEGSVTLYAWAKDAADVISDPVSATILFSTAAPVVSNIAVTDNGDGTATATWTTDINAEGSVKYGPVTMTGATPNAVSENALRTSHSVTFATSAGVNYKIILVNNEIASPAFYWPKPWPIDGDANGDCRVNILDLIFIRNKLNQPVGTGDNWKADVNEDTRINILDLIFVRNKLNTQCP